MPKRPERANWIKKIVGLRHSLGVSQRGLAKKLQVRPATVAAWEKGTPPSAEAYIALAKLTSYPLCLWFWEQALGGDMEILLSTAERVFRDRRAEPAQGEVVRVPLRRQLGHDSPQSARTDTVPLSAKHLPYPAGSLRAVRAPRDSVWPFQEGDVVIVAETPTIEDGVTLSWALGENPGDGVIDEASVAKELFGRPVFAYYAGTQRRDWQGWQGIRRLSYFGTSVVLVGDVSTDAIAITADVDWCVMGRVIGWLAQPGLKRKTRDGKRSRSREGGRRTRARPRNRKRS